MIPLKALFIIFVAFYVTVKIAFFIGIWVACGTIARKALVKKQQFSQYNKMRELKAKVAAYEQQAINLSKDKVIYGIRRNRYVS